MSTESFATLIAAAMQAEAAASEHATEVGHAFMEMAAADLLLLAKRRTLTIYAHAASLSRQSSSTNDQGAGPGPRTPPTPPHDAWQALHDAAEHDVRLLEARTEALKARLAAAQANFTRSGEEHSRECARLLAQLRSAHPEPQENEPAPATTPLAKITPANDDWSDLEPYYGNGAPHSRDCQMCGTTLSHGRRRFCSRACHDLYREAFPGPFQSKR